MDTATFDPHTPKRIDEIVGNTEFWKKLYKDIYDGRSGHFVLSGPAGCGKSLFLRLALSGFQTLYIDCTANSGLRDVRDSIRIFGRGSKSNDGKYRWIIFEHADVLTSDTQAFLRRMLETSSNTTRIVFECRDAGTISEPILSRCSVFTIKSPDHTEIVYEILRRSAFQISSEHAQMIAHISFGNVRSAMLYTLSYKHSDYATYFLEIKTMLEKRPISTNEKEWIVWAIETEQMCRIKGIDLRDVLRIGWSTHQSVATTLATWSRLGGTSPRTLFFNCVSSCISHA